MGESMPCSQMKSRQQLQHRDAARDQLLRWKRLWLREQTFMGDYKDVPTDEEQGESQSGKAKEDNSS